MKNELFIDGHDACADYGISVMEGTYASIASFPALKKVTVNDWFEYDGVEPDLTAPVLDSRKVSLGLAYGGGRQKVEQFIGLLTSEACHDFEFRRAGRTLRLRLLSQRQTEGTPDDGTMSIVLSEDSPLEGYSYLAPESAVADSDDYSMDGKYLSGYGISFLNGTVAALMRLPDVRTGLERKIASVSGVIYDGDAPVRFRQKDVKLDFLMRASSVSQLWRNRDAFLYDLVRPGLRQFACKATGKTYACYYKSATVSEFFAEDRIWMRATLVLTVTGSQDTSVSGTIE